MNFYGMRHVRLAQKTAGHWVRCVVFMDCSRVTVRVELDPRNQAYSEYKHSLTFRVRRYVVIATKLVHQLQIRSIVHN